MASFNSTGLVMNHVSTTSPARKSVLILGANGRVGGALVAAFHEAGWAVTAHTRRAPAAALAHLAGVRWAHAPIDQVAQLSKEVGSAAVVVNALNPLYTRWHQEALPMLRNAMELARRLNAFFMFPGNVYNYGSPMPAVLREDTPQQPSSRKGRLRVFGEAELQDAAKDGLRSVVIRAGDYFGSGSGSWLDMMMTKDLQRRQRVVYPGPLDRVHAWAYLPDLARVFVSVAEAREQLQPFDTLHFRGYAVTGRQFVDGINAAAQRLGWMAAGQQARVGAVPWWSMRLAAWLVPIAREVLEMRYLWIDPHELADDKLVRLIGAPRKTPLHEALYQALKMQTSATPTAAAAAQQAAEHAANQLATHR